MLSAWAIPRSYYTPQDKIGLVQVSYFGMFDNSNYYIFLSKA